MEAVLDLYAQPATPGLARLCMDERPCVLHGEVIAPQPMQPGKTAKQDYQYIRHGSAVALLAYRLETGQRYVEVRPHRTKADYATFLVAAVQALCTDTEHVTVVQDNLNTHTYGAFYTALSAPVARRWVHRLHFCYTPKHASWLNMAEIEFSALARQCLDRRIATIADLQRETAAWVAARNTAAVTVHWSFTVTTAREKLARQYTTVYSKD